MHRNDLNSLLIKNRLVYQKLIDIHTWRVKRHIFDQLFKHSQRLKFTLNHIFLFKKMFTTILSNMLIFTFFFKVWDLKYKKLWRWSLVTWSLAMDGQSPGLEPGGHTRACLSSPYDRSVHPYNDLKDVSYRGLGLGYTSWSLVTN